MRVWTEPQMDRQTNGQTDRCNAFSPLPFHGGAYKLTQLKCKTSTKQALSSSLTNESNQNINVQ